MLKSITSELPIDLVDDKALESKIQSQVPTEKNPDSQDPRRLKNPPTPPPLIKSKFDTLVIFIHEIHIGE
jgi:hypothetical protein